MKTRLVFYPVSDISRTNRKQRRCKAKIDAISMKKLQFLFWVLTAATVGSAVLFLVNQLA